MNERTTSIRILAALAWMVTVGARPAVAGDEGRDLARKLVNPLASLISVPLQYNEDSGPGPNDAERRQLNVQPVVPVELGARWKVISRTVVPLVSLAGGAPDGGALEGVGDLTESLFVTPSDGDAGGWLVGVGPALQVPIGSEARLSTGKWSVGPTAVAVRQRRGWTYGGLANHLWSVAGDAARPEVSSTFVQPFLGYVTSTRTTFALNAEATYDWARAEWTVPLHVTVSQLLKVGRQPLSVALGARYWAAAPAAGAEGWGLRAGVTLLFGGGPPAGG